MASKKISGEEDRYSRTDLWDFQANIDGAKKIVALSRPLLQKHDADLAQEDRRAISPRSTQILAKYRTKDGFESYEKLTDTDRPLKGPITALAEDLSTLRGLFGIS